MLSRPFSFYQVSRILLYYRGGLLIVGIENLPRRSEPATEDEEHRMSWMLVGMAVRLGYMLGLDQKTLRPVSPGGDRSNDDKSKEAMSETERLDREVLAWTCKFPNYLCILFEY